MSNIRLRGVNKLLVEIEATCRAIIVLEGDGIEAVPDTLRYRLRSNVYEVYARFGRKKLVEMSALLFAADPTLGEFSWMVHAEPSEFELCP
jgi:hypothetical protein